MWVNRNKLMYEIMPKSKLLAILLPMWVLFPKNKIMPMWVEIMPICESQIQFLMGIKSRGATGSEILLLSRTQCAALLPPLFSFCWRFTVTSRPVGHSEGMELMAPASLPPTTWGAQNPPTLGWNHPRKPAMSHGS